MSTARITHRSSRAGLASWGIGLTFAGLVLWGFEVREERYVVADAGVGYWLGAGGLACMTALLLYSVRKRVSALRPLGRIRRWLSVHMFLGILGPLCILFHCNFRLGSTNSNVALVCVLVVASSGLVGRVLYPRIHHGLAGRRATLKEIRTGIEAQRHGLEDALGRDPRLAEGLRELEAMSVAAAALPRLVMRTLAMGPRVRALHDRALALGVPAPVAGEYVAALRRVLSFRICERLFALWHAFHLPLCVLLFGAAAVHVLAVHLY